MAYINVAEWTADNVADWLKGLEDCILPYVSFFLNNNVNGCRLLLLTADDLVNLNVCKKGHQELILEGVDLLKQLHYNFTTETLQSQALRLGCKARSLFNQLKQDEADGAAAATAAATAAAIALSSDKSSSKAAKAQQQALIDGRKEAQAKKVDRVSTATLISVSEIVLSVKQFISWIDRYPFSSQDMYLPVRRTILCHSIELASTAQRDQFVDQPNSVIRSACLSLADLCDRIVQDVNDSLAISPASLEVVAIKKQANEDLGLQVYSSFNNSGIHIVGWIKRGSPSDRCARIEEGDEILQIRYQTVVGWQQAKLVNAMRESPTQVLLTLKKRPRHIPAPGRFELIKAQKLPVPRRPHVKSHSSARRATAAVASSTASSSCASNARNQTLHPHTAHQQPQQHHQQQQQQIQHPADPDSDDEGFETSYKQTQLKGPVCAPYRKPRHPVRRRATISGTTENTATPPVAIRIDDLVTNSVKGATSASHVNPSSSTTSSDQRRHSCQGQQEESSDRVILLSSSGCRLDDSRHQRMDHNSRSSANDHALKRSVSHDVTIPSHSHSNRSLPAIPAQEPPLPHRDTCQRVPTHGSGRDSAVSNKQTAIPATASSLSLSENKGLDDRCSASLVTSKVSATTIIPTLSLQQPSPEKAVSDGYMSGSVPSSSRSPSSSSSSPSTSSQISASGSADVIPTIEKMETLSLDHRSKQYKDLVGFNLAALRCKQRGPNSLSHSSSKNSSALNSCASVDSDENSTHSATSDSDSAFKQMQAKGPTPPPHRRPQVPRRRATISGASVPESTSKDTSVVEDKSPGSDSVKEPTTPSASTIPSPTVRGILSSTLTRIQESVSRSKDQQYLGRSNSHTSSCSGQSNERFRPSIRSEALPPTPSSRPTVSAVWMSEQSSATSRTLFAVSRNSTSPPEKTASPPVTSVASPLVLSSFRSSVSDTVTSATSPSAQLPRAKVVPLPPAEKPLPPIPDTRTQLRETIPKSVIASGDQSCGRVSEKEFKLKDPFRDPFHTQPEMHYVDVDSGLSSAEVAEFEKPAVKGTIYHQLMTGTSNPLSTRPAVGIVAPCHSQDSPFSADSKSGPSVISYRLKPKISLSPPTERSDVPPPLPLRSVVMLPAPKVAPRASLQRKTRAADPMDVTESPLISDLNAKQV